MVRDSQTERAGRRPARSVWSHSPGGPGAAPLRGAASGPRSTPFAVRYAAAGGLQTERGVRISGAIPGGASRKNLAIARFFQ